MSILPIFSKDLFNSSIFSRKEVRIIKNKKNITYTKTNTNVGLCSGVNIATKKVKTDYVLYAHDDHSPQHESRATRRRKPTRHISETSHEVMSPTRVTPKRRG